MKTQILRITVIALAGILAISGTAVAQEEKEMKPFGIIFNTGSILLEIESYQAGIGIKTLGEKFNIRYSGDIFAANSFNTLSLGFGMALEKPLKPGKVTPYIGGFGKLSLTSQRTTTDEDNWTNNISIPVSVGGLLGAEYDLIENISIFAEYELAADIGISISRVSTSGEVESTPTFSFVLDSRIGNNAKVGVVIYVK